MKNTTRKLAKVGDLVRQAQKKQLPQMNRVLRKQLDVLDDDELEYLRHKLELSLMTVTKEQKRRDEEYCTKMAEICRF